MEQCGEGADDHLRHSGWGVAVGRLPVALGGVGAAGLLLLLGRCVCIIALVESLTIGR